MRKVQERLDNIRNGIETADIEPETSKIPAKRADKLRKELARRQRDERTKAIWNVKTELAIEDPSGTMPIPRYDYVGNPEDDIDMEIEEWIYEGEEQEAQSRRNQAKKTEKPEPKGTVHDEAEDEAIEGTEEGDESPEMEEQEEEDAPGDKHGEDTLIIETPALPEDTATGRVTPPARAF